jgi:hypothetical protein
MAEPWSHYHSVVIETYSARRSGTNTTVHARPIEGQPFPPNMDVECSRAMRTKHPVGTRFRIRAKETNREGGKPFLYSHFSWPYEVVE